MPSVTIARDPLKFAPPSLDGTLSRRTLLDRLAAIPTPAKWLCAPSASGKSTLVAAYARAVRRSFIWYRVDPRDDDPAYFFPSFAGAAADRNGAATKLPRFGEADRGHEAVFSERFFSAVLACRRAALLIVFDDVQYASADWLVATLANLTGRAPARFEIVFVGDAPPPPPFFDAIVKRKLSLANDLDLSFSASECAALARLLRLGGVGGEEIQSLTGGHAGAVILACEFLRGGRPAHTPAPAAAATRELHAQLLGKLIDRLAPEQRDVLLRASFLPQVTAQLIEELLPVRQAAALLESLADRGLLVRFGTDAATSYQAHGLIRVGLQDLARQRLGSDAAATIARDCALVLQSAGMLEDALVLWTELGQMDQALALLETLAQRYARECRSASLLRAIAQLPAVAVASRPWIAYWAGRSLHGADERAACDWLERSFEGLHRQGDDAGALVVAASALAVLNYDLANTPAMQPWLQRFAELKPIGPMLRERDQRATFLLGLVCEGNLGGLDEAAGAANEAAFDDLVAMVGDDSAWLSREQMLAVATLLIEHAVRFYSTAWAQQVVAASQALAADENLGANLRGFWWLEVAHLRWGMGDHAGQLECIGHIEELLAETDSRALRFETLKLKLDSALLRGDVDAAATQMPAFEQLCVGGSPRDLAQLGLMTGRLLLRQGHYTEAVVRAEVSLDAAARAGFVGHDLRDYEVLYINALAADGRLKEAARRMHALADGLARSQRDFSRAMALCLDFLASDGADADSLRLGIELANSLSFVSVLQRTPALTARVCAAALARAIAPGFVRRIIEHQRLEPPDHAGASWPWKVRVCTLGGFRLFIGTEEYRPSQKAQDKPLELLKRLVACLVTGQAAPERAWLAEQMWPDADPSNARKSLEMTLARLRRLLGSDDAIESTDGRLRLSRRCVWTDVRDVLAALDRITRRRDRAAAGGRFDPLATVADLNAALSNYAGAFLADEDETPWILGARTHLSRTFCREVAACEALLDRPAPQAWLTALERALAVEPVAEDLARSLMRAYLAHGRHADALRVYRRLRDMLSIVLGVAPSEATEAVRRELRLAAEAGAAARPPEPASLEPAHPSDW